METRVGSAQQRIAARGEQWIQIREQDHGNPESRPRYDVEYAIEGHAASERLLRARLNDRAVRHRIRERNADFDDVGTGAFETGKQFQRRLSRRMTGGDIRNERAPFRGAQLREALRYALR